MSSEEPSNETHDEIIDIESYHQQGRKVPKGKKYKFRVNGSKYVSEVECMTGREILIQSGHKKPEDNLLYQLFGKGERKLIELDDKVCFTEPGLERFKTLPKDHDDGEEAGLALPPDDAEYVESLGLKWGLTKPDKSMWLILRQYPVPEGYTVGQVDMAIQIPDSYPSGKLDMAYFFPALALSSGRVIPQTNSTVNLEGKTWQRWSRHYTWVVGQHTLETHISSVDLWLQNELQRKAA